MVPGDKIGLYPGPAREVLDDFLNVVIGALVVALILMPLAHVLTLIYIAGVVDDADSLALANIVKMVQVGQLCKFGIDLHVPGEGETDNLFPAPGGFVFIFLRHHVTAQREFAVGFNHLDTGFP